MYVDVHTHSAVMENDVISVQNLTVTEQEKIFQKSDRFFSIGIHPWEAGEVTSDALVILRKSVNVANVKLIGECGLDKNADSPYENQLYFFEQQVLLSEAVQKPLMIHCVGYFNEIIQLRKKTQPSQKWIIHGFRGKPQLAAQLLNAGFDISFGEKRNEESVKITPVEHLFIETDESGTSAKNIYHSIAKTKSCTPEMLNAGARLLNVKTLFNLL